MRADTFLTEDLTYAAADIGGGDPLTYINDHDGPRRLVLSSLGPGRQLAVEARRGAVILDPGPNAVLIDPAWDTLVLGGETEVSIGSRVICMHGSAHEIRLESPVPLPKPSTDHRHIAALRILAAGQSLQEQMFWHAAGGALRAELFRADPSLRREGVSVMLGAGGGSAATQIGNPRTQWTIWTGEKFEPGRMAEISANAIRRTPPQEQAQVIVWDQGQDDGHAAFQDAAYVTIFIQATLHALARLRAEIAQAGGEVDLPIVIVPAGRQTGNARFAPIRRAQRQIVAELPGATLAPDMYDLALKDSVHPSEEVGQVEYGRRIARAVLDALSAHPGSVPMGPTAKVFRASGGIRIEISGADAIPESLNGLAVLDDKGQCLPIEIRRAGQGFDVSIEAAREARRAVFPWVLPEPADTLPFPRADGLPLRSFEYEISDRPLWSSVQH